MLVSFVLQDLGPDGPIEVVKLLARILLAGSLVAGVYGAVSLGVSSLTDRKAFAAGAVLLLLLVTGAITGALVDGLDAPEWLLAFNLAVSPLELVQRIYGERGELDDTSTALLFAVNIGWIVTGFSVLVVAVPPPGGDPMTAFAPPAAPARTTMIRLDHVSKWFGDIVAVSDLTFELGPGVTALLGPNGAGKSTVLRLLAGWPDRRRDRSGCSAATPARTCRSSDGSGWCPSRRASSSRMTAREFVEAAARLLAVRDVRGAAAAALELVELDPTDRRPVKALSKGNRQRVKVAAALVHDPEVLVLDEPLNGLDPRQRVHLIDLVRQLGQRDDRCVVVSSHVLDEVERFGSRILVIAQGRLAAEGDFRAIRDLMDDRPHRLRLVSEAAPALAAALLSQGVVAGARVTGPDRAEVETTDIHRFRREVAVAARTLELPLDEVVPLDDDLDSVFRYLVGR